MTTTPVTFTDEQRLVITILKAAIADRTPLPAYLLDGAGNPPTASSEFPDGSTGSPTPAHFQIAHDGTPNPGVQVETAIIRVTAWWPGDRPSDAKNAAAWAGAILGAARGWNIRPSAGRLPGYDRDTGLYFVSSTWRVRVKGIPLPNAALATVRSS